MLIPNLSVTDCLLLRKSMVSFLRKGGMHVELDQKRIGKRFRHVRKCAGLTQESFGEALNLSKNHISDIERGCSLPTVKVLINVYSQFGHTPDEILLGATPHDLDSTMKKITALTPTGRRLLEKKLDNLLDEGL